LKKIFRSVLTGRGRRAARWVARLGRTPVDRLRGRSAVRRARRNTKAVRDPRVVVFVSDTPRAREAKLATAARAAGLDVVLLYRERPNYDTAAHFTEARDYRDHWHALEIASSMQPLAYHLFSTGTDTTSGTFIRHKPGRVVFEFVDLIERMVHSEWSSELVPVQRYNIENCDALVARDLQARFAFTELGYRKPPRVLYFPDYCWGNTQPRAERASLAPGIHVALAGNFGIEKHGAADWGYIEIARAFARSGVHLHIYPFFGWSRSSDAVLDDVFSDYIALGKETGCVHVHRPLGADKVAFEISRYDAAINVIWALLSGGRIKTHSAAHFANCGSARNAEYLDAALPVVVSPQLRFQYLQLSRFGCAIPAAAGPLLDKPAEYLAGALGGTAMRERAMRARSAFSVLPHGRRLAEFYRSVTALSG
jgi:hypothetical protein